MDIFSFIGGSKAADALLKIHPEPHKLKASLALDAKNLGTIYYTNILLYYHYYFCYTTVILRL